MSSIERGPAPTRPRRLGRLSELQRRLDRARELVGRQRELAAGYGEQIPAAVALLRNLEDRLVLLEGTQAMLQRGLENGATQPLIGTSDTAGPKLTYEQKMRVAARVVEILSNAGYRCKLGPGRLQ
jgi:hypothetical protein